MIERAIALDPGYAHAHAWKACVLGQSFVNGWCADANATVRASIGEVTLALSLDENDSDVHRVLAAINLSLNRDHDKALYHQERALALNPNDDLIVVQQGEVLTWIGQADQGIEWIQKAMRLNPYHPERFWSHLGRAYFVARRYPRGGQGVSADQPPRPQPFGVSRGLPCTDRRRSGGPGRSAGGASAGAGVLDRALHRHAALQARK